MKRIIAIGADSQFLYTDEPAEANLTCRTEAYAEGQKPRPLGSYLKFQPGFWRMQD